MISNTKEKKLEEIEKREDEAPGDDELEAERKKYAVKVFDFLWKYFWWPPAVLFLPNFVGLFVDSESTYLLADSIMSIVFSAFILASSLYLGLPIIIQMLTRKPFMSAKTRLIILKEQFDSTKKGYRLRRNILWVLYICTVISIVSYVTFKLTIMFI